MVAAETETKRGSSSADASNQGHRRQNKDGGCFFTSSVRKNLLQTSTEETDQLHTPGSRPAAKLRALALSQQQISGLLDTFCCRCLSFYTVKHSKTKLLKLRPRMDLKVFFLFGRTVPLKGHVPWRNIKIVSLTDVSFLIKDKSQCKMIKNRNSFLIGRHLHAPLLLLPLASLWDQHHLIFLTCCLLLSLALPAPSFEVALYPIDRGH